MGVLERPAQLVRAAGAAAPGFLQAAQAETRLTRQVIELGGHPVPDRHPLAADPLGHAGNVTPVHQDAAPFGLCGQQRGEDQHVQQRERQAVALAQAGSPAAGADQDLAGQQHVPLTVHDPLRDAGGAAGEGDPGGRVPVGLHRRRRGGARYQPCPSPGFHHRAAPRAALRPGQDQRRSNEVGQCLLPVRRKGLVDPGPDRADALSAVKRGDDIEIVRQAGGDAVAGPDAELPHGARRRRRGPVEGSIGQRAGPGDDRGRVRPAAQGGAEDIGDRPAHGITPIRPA